MAKNLGQKNFRGVASAQGVGVCWEECPVFEISVQVELVVVSLGSKNLQCLVPAVLSRCHFR